jgi:hypothetical protein
VKLKDLATIRTNYPEADFWILMKGSKGQVGRPIKVFDKESIGIRVDRTDVLLPDYLYYAMQYLHQQGYWDQFDRGMTGLRHVTVSDVKNVSIG